MEQWKYIAELEGEYEISSRGRVRSSCKQTVRILVLRDNGQGYYTVRLKGVERKVHQLVARAFIGPRPDGHDVNHIDGNKKHNWDSNLEYATRSENVKHAYRTGLARKTSEDSPTAKLNGADVLTIKQRRGNGETLSDIAADYPVSLSTISKAALGRTWA